MTETVLTHTRTTEGVWEGLLVMGESVAPVPEVRVSLGDVALQDVSLNQIEGRAGEWALRFAIPAETLFDGVQTFLIEDTTNDKRLGSYTIVTGRALEDDFRAELDLLRAELDMLKRAFRRHCLETK
ncbi:MAG: hypothetical protein ACC631_09265 [Halocynthiibacter sp.]